MNYWLHRISHLAEVSRPLLQKGFLTIGYSDLSNIEFLEKVHSGDSAYFHSGFKKVGDYAPKGRYNLWRFLNFNQGDMVIVPSSRSFLICEIVSKKPILINEVYSDDLKTWSGKKITTNGTYLFREGEEKYYDLGFAWKVKIVYENISREKFADARLTSRMKIRQSTANINDLQKNIEKSIANFKENRPIHLHSIIMEKTADLVLETLRKELNPDKFEKLIKVFFKTIGANEVIIPPKNERGKEGDADTIAIFENIKLIIYIQAKFHTGATNQHAVTQIIDYKINKDSIDDGYNRIAWVITSADSFNDEAIKFAIENEIQLIDGVEFSKMLLNAGINLLNTNF